jgi:hypothetical protein
LADIKTFSDNVARMPSEKVYVSLSSEGGSAIAAEIGNYIRLSGMKTLVPVWPNWGSRRSSAIV